MNHTLRAEFEEYAKGQAPREACGLLVEVNELVDFMPAENLSTEPDRFTLSPYTWAKADALGEIVGIVHSHVNHSPEPSPADLAACEASALPWWIYSVQSGGWSHFEPAGYTPDLVGREFVHGVADCYSIIRDYYRQRLGLALPNYSRAVEWWEHGSDLYQDNFAAQGFREITLDQIQPGDAILMRIASKVPNHAAIYLGDGVILHHLQGIISRREPLHPAFLKRISHVLRYLPDHDKNSTTW